MHRQQRFNAFELKNEFALNPQVNHSFAYLGAFVFQVDLYLPFNIDFEQQKSDENQFYVKN